MQIQWFGLSCFKIQTKEAIILIDPFSPNYGLRPPHFKADLLLISHEHEDHNNRQAALGQPFIISSPGEYELKNVFVYGLPDFHDKKQGKEQGEITMFLLEAEGISLAHLSDLGCVPEEKKLERLEGVDILFIPVGGKYTIGAKEATEVISEIEPRIVIPMHYKIPKLKLPIEGVSKFCREMGIKESETQEKLKVLKKDLPQEETKVILLKPGV